MKKIFAIAFIALFVSAVVWLIIEGSRPEVLPVGSKLPAIEYAGFNGVQKLKADSTHKTVVIFFSEECPHCKYELNLLNVNAEKFKGVNIFLITLDKGLLTDGFTDKYPVLKKADNIKFGVVKKEDYKNKFGTMVTPALYFFNAKGMLTVKIKGETKMEMILNKIKN